MGVSFLRYRYLFFLINYCVCAGSDVQSLGMLLYEGINVAYALLFEYLVYGDEYAGFLHIAETVVDGGAKHLHRGA